MTSETACELCPPMPADATLMKRCACLQREIARARLAAAMQRYEHCSLDNLREPGAQEGGRSRRFIDEFPDVEEPAPDRAKRDRQNAHPVANSGN